MTKGERRMKLALLALSVAVSISLSNGGYAQEKKGNLDLRRAQETVDRIRQAEPPQVQRSTGTPTADEIARRENERERQRQAEESRRRQIDRGNVPPPGR